MLMSVNSKLRCTAPSNLSSLPLLRSLQNCVPQHNPVAERDVKLLEQFISKSKKLVVLTGAGISTESGIPDYRSEGVGLYARSNQKPIQHIEFLKSPAVRQRYWARNYVGWERFSSCKPNQTHILLRKLEREHEKVSSIITQNVDGLHYKAGSRDIIELHGTAFTVICLNCNASYSRHYIQELIVKLNPGMKETSTMIRPDGDVDLPQDKIVNFHPPFCESCNGVLKPDIVFFGDNVPKSRVSQVQEAIAAGDSVLVLGSSLSVFSGYRIVLQAVELKKNIAIINIGPTRADKLNNVLKITARCGEILPKIC